MTTRVRRTKKAPKRSVANGNRGSGRTAKNGSARPKNGVHRVDLKAEELEVIVQACRKYRALLPGYLASAQDDIARAQALIDKLENII